MAYEDVTCKKCNTSFSFDFLDTEVVCPECGIMYELEWEHSWMGSGCVGIHEIELSNGYKYYVEFDDIGVKDEKTI